MNMSDDKPITIAAVEGGGTSFVVAVARISPWNTTITSASPPEILCLEEIDSSHDQPQQTLKQCAEFFQQNEPMNGYDALGIAMFGPVGLDPNSDAYGTILSSSPKAFWRNVNFLRPLKEACQRRDGRPLSISIDTDVNAPALAEFKMAKKEEGNNSITSLAYITVGTGVGVGLIINGKAVHGRMHPEGGHVSIQSLDNDPFEGYSWGKKCPYRGKRTVESMTSSVALTERLETMTGKSPSSRHCLEDLDDDHELWDHAANALANLCVNLILTTSIEKIVLGGGIMKRNGLIDKIRSQVVILLNGYVDLPKHLSEFITLSSFGSNVGLVGAIALAQQGILEKLQDELPVETADVLRIKRTAYGVGLHHGVLVGVSVSFMAYCFLTRSKKR